MPVSKKNYTEAGVGHDRRTGLVQSGSAIVSIIPTTERVLCRDLEIVDRYHVGNGRDYTSCPGAGVQARIRNALI